MQDIQNILESLLFVAEEPLSVDRLKNILETTEASEIKAALQSLTENYDNRGGGFRLYEVAGGWQLRSRPEYNEWIKRLLQPAPQRLSKPALETLAIVAYNQPIIRADIEHIRGVDCGGVLRQLMERKLVRVLGRKEIPGRPLIYATTKLFLELFGLKDLKDLPSPKEIEEMTAAMEKAESETAPPTYFDETDTLFDTQDTFAALGNRTVTDASTVVTHAKSRGRGATPTAAKPVVCAPSCRHAGPVKVAARPHIAFRVHKTVFSPPPVATLKSGISPNIVLKKT